MACDMFPEAGGCHSPKASMAVGCLSPRISFSSTFAELDTETDASLDSYDSMTTDFDFSMALSNLSSISEGIMLSADELFCNGKLLPLQLWPQYRSMDAHVLEISQKEDFISPKELHLQCYEQEKDSLCLHEMSSDFCTSSPPESRHFAPPSPETPKCSVMLRDLFGTNKAPVSTIKESSGKLIATSKLWKTLVRGVLTTGKKGASRSGISEESLRVSASTESDFKASYTSSSHAAALLSSVPSRITSSASCERQQRLAYREALHKDHESFARAGSPAQYLAKSVQRSMVVSADDSHMLPRRRLAASYRSASMPNSRCTSPEKRSNPQKPVPKGSEKLSTAATGRLHSDKVILKNMERCSPNQKVPVKRQQEQGHALQQRDYRRTPEKSSYTSNVRVTPVLSVPLSVTPVRNSKLAKGRFSSFKELFSPRKETAEFMKESES